MKWSEAFCDILYRWIGVRNVPIVYVIIEDVAVTSTDPDMMSGKPHYK